MTPPAKSKFLSERDSSLSGVGRKIANYVAMATMGLGVIAPNDAEGALYSNGTPSAAPLQMGMQFAGDALSLRVYSPRFGPGQANASATFLNSRFALTSAHNLTTVLGSITSIEVADGSNYLTSRGNVMSVESYIIHPSLDIAILQFSDDFPVGEAKVIGSAIVGDSTYSAGFGSAGTPATGTSRDGGLRAWDARVADLVFSGSAPFYGAAGMSGGIDLWKS